MESVYFSDAVQRSSDLVSKPTLTRYFPILSPSAATASEPVMMLEDGSPFLMVYLYGQGRVMLSAVPLDDSFGDAHRNALFFVPLHNVAIMNVKQGRLYNTIGVDESAAVSNKSTSADKVYKIQAQDKSMEFIPEQRLAGNEVMLYFHSQIEKAGLYDVFIDDVKITSLAFNYNRSESNLDYYNRDELKTMTEGKAQMIDARLKDLSKSISDSFNGTPLWQYFLLFALLCIIAEICVLRFWKIKNN